MAAKAANPWTLLGAAALLAATAVAAPASAHEQDDLSCVRLSTGETACGRADASICSGAGEGVATGPVHWTLRVVTSNPYSTKDHDSPTATPSWAGGGAAAQCWTTTCTWAYLYANGELVDASDYGVC